METGAFGRRGGRRAVLDYPVAIDVLDDDRREYLFVLSDGVASAHRAEGDGE
jgi:hypothetical protein